VHHISLEMNHSTKVRKHAQRVALVVAAAAIMGCGVDDDGRAAGSGTGGSAGATMGSGGGAGRGGASAGGSAGDATVLDASDGTSGGAGQGGGSATDGAGGASGGAHDDGGDSGELGRDGSLEVDGSSAGDGASGSSAVPYVFVVLEENHDWSATKNLPYIAHLLQIGAHSEQYYNPKGLHPSEPNYIWLEAGSNHGLTTDADPSSSHLIRGATHLTKLLGANGISWMSYQEDIKAGKCPIASSGKYAAKHDPFVFFDDVVGDPPSADSPPCIEHHRPFSRFLPDLKNGTVAHYNFITPNLQNDMHDGAPAQGDNWLKTNIDPIINPSSPSHNAAIYAHAVLIVTWDEGMGGSDGPIGFIVVSPFAKVGYSDAKTASPYYYTHSSTLLTLQRIFDVAATPLGAAAGAHDLGALLTSFP
jgi:hypothetical protein